MSIPRNSSSKLLAVLLIVLVGAIFIANTHVSSLQRGSSGEAFAAQSGTQADFLMQIEPNQFLMRNSTSANVGIVFTLLNGFVGNVTLSAMVSPIERSGPTVSFNPSTVELNASLPGSPFNPMLVTTNMTESGVYTITVTSSSASISHSATATVGVTSVFVPGNGADLVYRGSFTAAVDAGSSTILKSSFLDLGYVPIGIVSLKVTLSFGTYIYHPTCQLIQNVCVTTNPFLWLNPYDENTTALTIVIPDTTSAGNYTLTTTITWLLNPLSIDQQWAPDLVAYGYLIVHSSNPNPPPPPLKPPPSLDTFGLYNGLFGFMALGGAVTILVVFLAVLIYREKQPRFERLPTETLFCPQCGRPAAFGAKFCAQCGHQIP
jgi:hypothetical protein